MLVPLAGCVTSGNPPPSVMAQLPVVPADIQKCFQGGPVNIPARALTAGEVEVLWGNDRVRIAVMKKCGARFMAWYESLRGAR
jgi:hypothetical protein